MDYEVIQKLMKDMNESSLTCVEIEIDGLKLKMERNLSSPMPYPPVAPVMNGGVSMQSFSPIIEPKNFVQSIKEAEEANNKEAEKANLLEEDTMKSKITSPMVGTFYRASSPDKAPFVKVGDKVKKGQTLCIIEAMKLMNDIESEYDGEVVDILCKNEQMVEFGQPLFLLKTADEPVLV